MGTSPASPQIHQKLLKIWKNSYKATSRRQQKTPGLQGDRLSSLKWSRREDRNNKIIIIMKREKNFWTGARAPRDRGSYETGGVPMHKEAPSPASKSCGVLKTGESRGLEGRKQRSLHFSACEQLADCGPSQTVGSGNWEACRNLAAQRGWAHAAGCGAAHALSGHGDPSAQGSLGSKGHTGPATKREGQGAEWAHAPQSRGQAWGAQTWAHKPHSTDAALRGLSEACTTLRCRKYSQGAKKRSTQAST